MSATGEKVVIVSSDTHIGPRLREDLRQYCPQQYLDDFDRFTTYIEDVDSGLNAGLRPGQDPAAVARHLRTAGHYDPHARLRDLDQDGTACEVIFHGSQNHQPVPFISSDASVGKHSMERIYEVDYELAAVGRHIYNQWLADFCSVEPERHVGLAHLPMWNIDDAVKEATWAAEHGLRGVNFPAEAGPEQHSRSRWGGQFKYHDPVWEPFWSACEDLGLVLATHGGAGDPDDLPGGYPIWLYEVNELTRRPMHRLIMSGVFERHPNLKTVVTEQPGDWWLTKMHDLDTLQWMAQLPKKPSQYMRDNCFLGAAFQARFEAKDAVENDYWQNILWGTDYPHVEGTWLHTDDMDAEPMSHIAMRYTYAGIDPEKVKAMIGLNAVKVYNLDGEYLHKVAQTINAPTMEQLQTPVDAVPEGAGMWAFRQLGAFA
jgi:predicted TIM-barrel fold metal-dependent hydrolase